MGQCAGHKVISEGGMNKIFLTVIHLVKHEDAGDGIFSALLEELKGELVLAGDETKQASVTVMAVTGLLSCEVIVAINCADKTFAHLLNEIAARYSGTFFANKQRRA